MHHHTSNHRPARSRLMRPALLVLLALGLTAPALAETPATPATTATTSPMSEAQLRADLAHMRQEEKLARDVYVTLNEKQPHQTFAHIQQSEQRHMQAIGRLLQARKIADPLKGLEDKRGVYKDAAFGELYKKLVKRGEADRVSALKVGAWIEEQDIKDLRERLARKPPAEVAAVYENLLRASGNHLRAFHKALAAEGVTYTAQVLTDAEVKQLVAQPHACGCGQEHGGEGHGKGHGKHGHGKHGQGKHGEQGHACEH